MAAKEHTQAREGHRLLHKLPQALGSRARAGQARIHDRHMGFLLCQERPLRPPHLRGHAHGHHARRQFRGLPGHEPARLDEPGAGQDAEGPPLGGKGRPTARKRRQVPLERQILHPPAAPWMRPGGRQGGHPPVPLQHLRHQPRLHHPGTVQVHSGGIHVPPRHHLLVR